jgi:hypothetical protein
MPAEDELDDFIKMQLFRNEAPAGSPQATINERYPTVGWSDKNEMNPSLSLVPETDDEAYNSIDKEALEYFWKMLPGMTNEAGARSFMESPGPMSQNVEDRREQTPMSVVPEVLQWLTDQEGVGTTPQDYIRNAFNSMYANDYYTGGSPEFGELPPGMAPSETPNYSYPTRKISR